MRPEKIIPAGDGRPAPFVGKLAVLVIMSSPYK
jgi:hypothetical protein